MEKKLKTDAKLGCPEPSRDEITMLAYQIYEQEGRPHGRDLEHWLQAELLLKNGAVGEAAKAPDQHTTAS